MIKVDRRVISAIQNMTDNYHDEMTADSTSAAILMIDHSFTVKRRIPVKATSEDIDESIDRLISMGLLRMCRRWNGGFSFCMTSRMKHRHAFWWDSFSKRFIGGFFSGLISGIIITVLGGLLLLFLRAKLGI